VRGDVDDAGRRLAHGIVVKSGKEVVGEARSLAQA